MIKRIFNKLSGILGNKEKLCTTNKERIKNELYDILRYPSTENVYHISEDFLVSLDKKLWIFIFI